MAITLIKENLRNPMTNTWIPLREIEGDDDGNVTAIKQLGIDEYPLSYVTPEPGIMVPSDGTEVPTIPYPVGYKEGEVTPLKTTYIFKDGIDVNLASPLALSNGTFVQETPSTALENLNISSTQSGAIKWDGDTSLISDSILYKDTSFYRVSDIPTFVTGKENFEYCRFTLTAIDGGFETTFDISPFSMDERETDFYVFTGIYTGEPNAQSIPVCMIIFNQISPNFAPGIYFRKDSAEYLSKLGYYGPSVIGVESGGTGASTAAQALHNLGITWGTSPADEKGTPGSIYIQLLPVEEDSEIPSEDYPEIV